MLSFVIVQAFILGSAFDANPPETDCAFCLVQVYAAKCPHST